MEPYFTPSCVKGDICKEVWPSQPSQGMSWKALHENVGGKFLEEGKLLEEGPMRSLQFLYKWRGGELFPFMHMFMILSWSFWLLEHAGCLTSLQHCLVHRVSPFRDLTLSPRGLWVPTRVRFSHHYFFSRPKHHPPRQRYCCSSIILCCRVLSWRLHNTTSIASFSEGESFLPLEDQFGSLRAYLQILASGQHIFFPLLRSLIQ